MPPKKKLPRKGKARQGELDLETAAEERIDAVTAEPLGEKFIEVISPDGTLKLFYNTSTLIRIALHKNGFMQPPHFREPMNPSMIKKIEQIEGKAFSFHEDIHRHDGEEDGAAIVHRHVFFDQIMDEFYLLNPAELFVCPVCYAHYVEHYYIPAHAAGGEPVEYIDDGATPVVDPLQVLNHMLRHPLHPQEEAVDVDEEGEETHPDSVLPLIVFRSAAKLKKHLKLHHDVFVTKVSEEYKLKPMLNTYFFAFNQLNEIKFKEGKLRKKKLALNISRYWNIDARYNRLRYNRVVEAVEDAESRTVTEELFGFPGETVSTGLDLTHTDDKSDDDDFVVDDSSEGEFIARYSPSFPSEEEEEEEEVEKVRRRSSHRKRAREPSEETTSDETDEEDEEEDEVEEELPWWKRPPLRENLSAEDYYFVKNAKYNQPSQTTLYQPTISKEEKQMEEVDWDRLGGSFEPIKPIRVKAPTPPRPSVDLTKAKLLLDDEEEENAPTTNNSNANSSSVNGTPSGGRPSSASKAAPKILLDDE